MLHYLDMQRERERREGGREREGGRREGWGRRKERERGDISVAQPELKIIITINNNYY